MRIFEPGEIVKITTTGFNWTIDGWATVGNESGEGVIEIFERVDLRWCRLVLAFLLGM